MQPTFPLARRGGLHKSPSRCSSASPALGSSSVSLVRAVLCLSYASVLVTTFDHQLLKPVLVSEGGMRDPMRYRGCGCGSSRASAKNRYCSTTVFLFFYLPTLP